MKRKIEIYLLEGCFRFIKLIKERENGFYDSNFSKEFKRYSVCGNTFIITNFYPENKDYIIKKCKEYNVDGLFGIRLKIILNIILNGNFGIIMDYLLICV